MLEELTEEEFRTYLDKSPYKTFMQTPEIAKLREKNGWNSTYLGMKEGKKLVAATLLLSKKRHFGKYEFYALRGPLIDFHNSSLLKKFLTELEKYAKSHNGYSLRMDPYLVYKERDSAGLVIEGGVDNSKIVDEIKSLGFKKIIEAKEEQVSFMYALDTEGKSEDDIMKNMRANTRNRIRKTLKNGIEITELKEEELDEFYKIMLETGKRKGFAIRNLDYFKEMYRLFKPRDEIKYLVTKLDLNKHLGILKDEKNEQLEKRAKISDTAYNEGKRKAIDDTVSSIDKRIKIAEDIKAKDGDVITLSGSMFILTRPEVIYLSSGNYEEYLMYNSQYLIQWEMIKYALNNGYKRYNFYGIPSTFDKNDKDYGIYEFKTGFQGYVEQLIGEYVKPLSPVYYLIALIQKIK